MPAKTAARPVQHTECVRTYMNKIDGGYVKRGQVFNVGDVHKEGLFTLTAKRAKELLDAGLHRVFTEGMAPVQPSREDRGNEPGTQERRAPAPQDKNAPAHSDKRERVPSDKGTTTKVGSVSMTTRTAARVRTAAPKEGLTRKERGDPPAAKKVGPTNPLWKGKGAKPANPDPRKAAEPDGPKSPGRTGAGASSPSSSAPAPAPATSTGAKRGRRRGEETSNS